MLSEEKLRGVAALWSAADVPLLLDDIRELQAQVETTTWYNGTLLTELSTLREQLAELEGQLNPPCPDPSIDAFYLEADKGG